MNNKVMTKQELMEYLKISESTIRNYTNKTNLTADLMRYYEVDLNNCTMTNEQWIAELVEALTDEDYLNNFNKELELYNKLK